MTAYDPDTGRAVKGTFVNSLKPDGSSHLTSITHTRFDDGTETREVFIVGPNVINIVSVADGVIHHVNEHTLFD